METLPSTRHKLLIADGTSIVRRVYEAVKGDDTPERAEGAMRSSWGSFLRALREHEPTHFLAAFDHGGETWRHRLYDKYKEHRKPTPAPLKDALPGLLERMNNAGLRTLRVPEVEADDTVATLAVKAAARGFEVVVLATDKDMLVLLDRGIQVHDHFQSEPRDAQWVQERFFGVKPSQMTDYLALMGDDSDGIPGVDQVGEKTAARLLLEYGDLDTVYEHINEVKGKLGERLRAGAPMARLSRELATLRLDVPIGMSPREMALPAALLERMAHMPEPTHVRTTPTGEQVLSRPPRPAGGAPTALPSRRLRM